MATAIEYGLISALVVVVGITGMNLAGIRPVAEHHFPYVGLEKVVLPVIPPEPHWVCPQGTVMLETSRFYPPVQPACVAGAYAVSTTKQ